LADHFNDHEGAAWPSHGRVAKMAGVSEDTVRRHLRNMEELGLVSSKPREGRSNLYVLSPAPMQPPAPMHPLAPMPPTPRMDAPPPPAPMHPPSPIYTTLNEPLKNPTIRNVNAQPYSGDPLPSGEQVRRATMLREMLEKGVREHEEVDFDTGTASALVTTETTE